MYIQERKSEATIKNESQIKTLIINNDTKEK